MNVCLSIHAPKVRVPETLLGRPRALIAFVTAVDNRGVHSFSLSLSLSQRMPMAVVVLTHTHTE